MMVGLRYRATEQLVDAQGFPPDAIETPNADRSQRIFGTHPSNPEIKFPADDGLVLVNPSRSSCSSAEAFRPQTACTARTAKDCSPNEVAIATIWLIFLALLIGLSVVVPLLQGAIKLAAD
jgi:hypothetical protein